MLSSCSDVADRPVVRQDLASQLRIYEGTVSQTPRGLSLLLVVDNSPSMAPYGEQLERDVGVLLRQLTGALCLEGDPDAPQEPVVAPDDDGYCPRDSQWISPRALDLHVGVVSSSLGGPGCARRTHGDDGAWLLPRVREGLPQDDSAGFLVWRGRGSLEGLDAFVTKVQHHVRAVGSDGCAFQAPLEVVQRFFTAEVGGAEPLPNGTFPVDEALDQQRAAFLPRTSDAAVILIGSSDDCSLPPGTDVSSVAPEVLDAEDDGACARLVASFPGDPRHSLDRYGRPQKGFSAVSAGGWWIQPGRVTPAFPLWLVPRPLWQALQETDPYGYAFQSPRQLQLLGPSSSSRLEVRKLLPIEPEPGREHGGLTHLLPAGEPLRPGIGGWCIGMDLTPDGDGRVSCRVLEARLDDPSEAPCGGPGRRDTEIAYRDAVRRKLDEDGLCGEVGQPCEAYSVCEVEQLVGEDARECREEVSARTSGFCYVSDPQSPFLDSCQATARRLLRVVSPPAHPLPPPENRLYLWCEETH